MMWLAFFLSLYTCSIALYMVEGVYGLDDGFLNVKYISELETNGFIEALSQWYISTSGNLWHELINIFLLIGLIIIPQVFSYIISGIFGCAQTPYFIVASTNFAIIFIIKSICVFCALQFSIEAVRWYTVGPEDIEWEMHIVIQNLYLLLIAFSLAAAYYFIPNGWLAFIQSHHSDAVNKVISFMTRHNYANPPHETR
ncbi:hypothetical protein [Agrobacterium vitis]|uniref:Uncharacterized protein n=1 Tax=Agrobacterium vitis TaxID=373 RepID=A0AAE2RB29_AGRVI|nr:hypothetical protein [Agrobacterium vitis]MBF2715026.1 hypothetical protein [Agrobacterium vitis]